MSQNWKYQEPTGPTLNRGEIKSTDANYPLFIFDERTEQEIDQYKFNKWQEQYEYEMQHPE